MPRSYRAGDSVEDFCRACKTDRMHTVVAADPWARRFAWCAAIAGASTTIAAVRGSEPAAESAATAEPRPRPPVTRGRERREPAPDRQRARKDGASHD